TVRLDGSGLRAVLYTDTDALIPGDRIQCRAEVLRPAADRDFDFDRYLRAEDIWLTVFPSETPQITGHSKSLSHSLSALSENIRTRISEALPGDAGGILTGVMLGGRSELSDAFSEAASVSGLSHMFAVSGMHLAVLAGVLLFFFRSRYAVFLLIPLCGLFAVMTGLSPSVLRAAFVLILPLLAPWFSREGDRLNTLFFALTVLLIANPARIASLSLLYSFGAMLGLILYGDRLHRFFSASEEKLPRLLRPVWRFLAAGTAAWLAASLFTLPITAFVFRHLSLLGLPANLALVWTLPFLFIGGYVLYFLLLLFPSAGLFAAGLVRPLLSGLVKVVLFFGQSGFSLGLSEPALQIWFILAYGGLLLCLMLPPHRPRLFWGAASAGLLCAALLIAVLPAAHSVRVDWLDVGSGQCVLLQDGKSSVLLDCGGERAAETAAEALSGANLAAADILILSHTDSDHSGGVITLISEGRVRHLVLSSTAEEDETGAAIIAAARDADIPVTVLRQDSTLSLPRCTLTLFAADPDSEQPCITALLSAHGTEVFFAADISASDELKLLRRTELPDLEILSVAHHGSKYSTSALFLSAVTPETAVISVGENTYGHPHPDTLSRLISAGADVHTTLSDGRLRLSIRKGSYTLRPVS
ncbi:MAG: ComEC/Rec2 family competence protein, partial [Clostridia bacterium]|nr:ComEC/Rec2 family competence protein [Clostridia bacterium]